MARTRREVPLVYDDNFRGLFTYTFIPVVVLVALLLRIGSRSDVVALLTILCGVTAAGSFAYLVWTHLLFTRTPHEEATRIAAAQQRQEPGILTRLLGFNQQNARSMALSSAALTLVVAISAILLGSRGAGSWLPAVVLATAATSWATMVYSFALQYFRLHSAGERIAFDIEEEPQFTDFLSMSVMVSSVGAMSAGTPRTRAGLIAVRTHTYIAFIFNALVVAMTVSILGSLIGTMSGS